MRGDLRGVERCANSGPSARSREEKSGFCATWCPCAARCATVAVRPLLPRTPAPWPLVPVKTRVPGQVAATRATSSTAAGTPGPARATTRAVGRRPPPPKPRWHHAPAVGATSTGRPTQRREARPRQGAEVGGGHDHERRRRTRSSGSSSRRSRTATCASRTRSRWSAAVPGTRRPGDDVEVGAHGPGQGPPRGRPREARPGAAARPRGRRPRVAAVAPEHNHCRSRCAGGVHVRGARAAPAWAGPEEAGAAPGETPQPVLEPR